MYSTCCFGLTVKEPHLWYIIKIIPDKPHSYGHPGKTTIDVFLISIHFSVFLSSCEQQLYKFGHDAYNPVSVITDHGPLLLKQQQRNKRDMMTHSIYQTVRLKVRSLLLVEFRAWCCHVWGLEFVWTMNVMCCLCSSHSSLPSLHFFFHACVFVYLCTWQQH